MRQIFFLVFFTATLWAFPAHAIIIRNLDTEGHVLKILEAGNEVKIHIEGHSFYSTQAPYITIMNEGQDPIRATTYDEYIIYKGEVRIGKRGRRIKN